MNHLLGLKWQSLLNPSFVCQISADWIEKQNSYLGKNIEFLTRPADIFLIPYFWPIFANFQKETDCLSVNSLIDKDPKWLFFMSWSNFRLRLWLSNPSQISSINAMVTFLWLIKRVYFSWAHPVLHLEISLMWEDDLSDRARNWW